jgi:membrane protein implicated in regulation of membrane protease activity
MHNMRAIPIYSKTKLLMMWTVSVTWWVVSAVLVGAELLSGTFYLLAIAIAFAAGGVCAWLGLPFAMQILVAAAVGIVAVALLRRWKAQKSRPKLPASLDVGQAVQVAQWRDDGTARVNYRGAQWDAELENTQVPRQTTLYIAAVRGSVLVLSDRRPAG